jgi:hypothetical protein
VQVVAVPDLQARAGRADTADAAASVATLAAEEVFKAGLRAACNLIRGF